MERCIAFLRGINVSGQKLIKMEDLRKHFELPGFKNIATYIQSGNVLFDTKETEPSLLCAKIEKQLEKKLGYAVPTIVRPLSDIKRVIQNNPYHTRIPGDERKLYVCLLSAVPDILLHSALDEYGNDLEEATVLGSEVYLLLSSGAKTKLSNSFIEKKLKVTGTMRNWATINKVLDL